MIDLRDHIVRVAVSLIVCSTATFVFATRILEWLLLPIAAHKDEVRIMADRPTAAFGMYMKIALFGGAILAMPFVVYQVLHYVLPGLTRREKRSLFWVIPGATFFFLGGAAFAYFVMIPPAIAYLFRFWQEYIDQLWTLEEYLAFVTGLVFWVGVSFETPLIMAFVARLGVVTAGQMLSVWRFAVVGVAILAAVITPTADWFNMTLVTLPLIVLYFLGVFLSWLAQPKRLL